MDNRKEIAEKIITALTNRSGFNDLWYNLDEDIQIEITNELVNILPIQNVRQRSLLDTYNNERYANDKAAKEIKAFCEYVMHPESDLHKYADEWISERLK